MPQVGGSTPGVLVHGGSAMRLILVSDVSDALGLVASRVTLGSAGFSWVFLRALL